MTWLPWPILLFGAMAIGLAILGAIIFAIRDASVAIGRGLAHLWQHLRTHRRG